MRQDPNSTNLRKPFLGADDKPVSDSRSGLFCAFNAGTTTVTVRAGGLSFAQQVRILPGSVQRPCGTRPLRPDRFRRAADGRAGGAAAGRAAGRQRAARQLPAAASPGGAGTRRPAPSPAAGSFTPAFLPPLEPTSCLPPVPLPVAPALLRPSPPSGGFGRAFEKQREEEVAPEEMQAFARYHPRTRASRPATCWARWCSRRLPAASIFGGPRGRPRRAPHPPTRPDQGDTDP